MSFEDFQNPSFFRKEEQHTGRKERNKLCRRLFDGNTIRMKGSQSMIGSPNITFTLWIEENISRRRLLIDFSIAKGFMKMKIRGKRPTSRVLANELFGNL